MEYEAFLAKLNPDGEWTWSLMIDKAIDTDLRVRDIKFNPKDDILIDPIMIIFQIALLFPRV